MAASSGPEPAAVARLCHEVGRLLRSQVIDFRYTPGGWSVSVRGVLTLAGGRTVFAKLGDVPDTAAALRDEIRTYGLLGERAFMPRFIAADPEVPLLVVEDLSHAVRVPPWTDRALALRRRLCDELAATTAPAGLPALEPEVVDDGWKLVAADPARAAGVLPPAWLERNLPSLCDAERHAHAGGSDLVHTDLRSDNLLFLPDRAIAVDWNLARRGDARWDPHVTAHTVAMEGGGSVEEVLPDPDPAIIAWLAGFFASRAGLAPPEGAPRVREFQRAQLEVVLPWACRLLGLPPPA